MTMPHPRRLLTALLICLLPIASILVAAPAIPDGMNVIDLSELEDGETREFGQGEHRISATRTGDTVVVTMSDPGDDGAAVQTISCGEEDRCLVMLGDGDEDQSQEQESEPNTHAEAPHLS